MLNTSNLPPGVHVERDRDDGTTHIINLTDKAVDVDLGDGREWTLPPGCGVAVYEGTNVVALTAPRCPRP